MSLRSRLQEVVSAWCTAAVRGGRRLDPADLRRVEPIARNFGAGRGTPVDQWYIHQHLKRHAHLLTGRLLEVADDLLTRTYGAADASRTIMSLIPGPGVSVVCDLTKHETLPERQFDAIVLTQTLCMVQDPAQAIAGAWRLVAPGGVIVGTEPCISPHSRFDEERWGERWRFTGRGLREMASRGTGLPESAVEIATYGNALGARCLFDGICIEDLPDSALLNRHDRDYPMIIGWVARRDR